MPYRICKASLLRLLGVLEVKAFIDELGKRLVRSKVHVQLAFNIPNALLDLVLLVTRFVERCLSQIRC